MTVYAKTVGKTPQTEAASPKQVRNSAGGFVFQLDCWKRLDRFLILGADSPTYYVTAPKLARDNAQVVVECLEKDGPRAVARVVEISKAGRAPKNDPAIFVLAMALASKDPRTRKAAVGAVNEVCRIGTHLFHLAADVESVGTWPRSIRRAFASWYTTRSIEAVAMQAIKYQQRDGWGHRDVLRLAHPEAPSPEHNALFRWITSGGAEGLDRENKAPKKGGPIDSKFLPEVVRAFERIHAPGVSAKEAIGLIREFELPHECVPNELKNDPKVWTAMLPHMGVTAMIRNLGKLTAVGALKPLSIEMGLVVNALTDRALLKKGRVHPITILMALRIYASGHGFKGSLTWTPAREVTDALDEAFYLAFDAVPSTNKRHLLALDISGSMGAAISQTSPITCREASAAMAMAVARNERNWHCMGFGRRFDPLPISPRQRLDNVVSSISNLDFQSTDCSLPMQYALHEKLEVDVFSVWTDNETYAGSIHPHQALEMYRHKMGIPAKLVVCGMTATGFSIANPDDAGMLDVVGFDASVPEILADFATGG